MKLLNRRAPGLVAPNGLRVATADGTKEGAEAIAPLFNSSIVNTGPLSLPGSILPGPDFLATSLDVYSAALGYAMGKLYVAYAEQVASGRALHEAESLREFLLALHAPTRDRANFLSRERLLQIRRRRQVRRHPITMRRSRQSNPAIPLVV